MILFVTLVLIISSSCCSRACDISGAATAVYNFWLYDYCDYYLEHVCIILLPFRIPTIPCLAKPYRTQTKPVFKGGDAVKIQTTQHIMHACVGTGLRLLSPFMPFITEELYQRLPRSVGCISYTHAAIITCRHTADDVESICVAPFPKTASFAHFADDGVEKDIETLKSVAALIRSIAVRQFGPDVSIL